MASSAIGRVRGSVIELEAPLPALEGRRVRIVIEPTEEPATSTVSNAPMDDTELTPEERSRADVWRAGTSQTIPAEEMRARILGRSRQR